MYYSEKLILKNGREALIRNGDAADGAAVYVHFMESHAETDYLLSYPDENSFDAEQEADFLAERTKSPNAIQLIALVDGRIVGSAGIEPVGKKDKVKHRAELGITVSKAYWGLGLGRALMQACIHCAREAGYEQLELNAVAENERALNLYRSCGFTEFGRNPRGFKSRTGAWQELTYMLLPLWT